MPTPNDETTHAAQFPGGAETLSRPSPITTCPPEESRTNARLRTISDASEGLETAVNSVPQQQPTPPADDNNVGISMSMGRQTTPTTRMDYDEEPMPLETPSPTSSTAGIKDKENRLNPSAAPATFRSLACSALASAQYDFSGVRLLPNYTSSFLRPGSKFRGTQQSERQIYDVQVDLKYVDMDQSFLCGYLRIQGLTEDHPTLTTYFEGEIVGDKYSFQTKHPEWGSNDRVDMHHWARFNAWRPLAKLAKKPDFSYKNFMQREHLFMRWKEYFLVPDHKVRTISGASFEGFYYICFNQISGAVSGIYFHAKSEKHQQLELTHVQDRGALGAMEFR